MEEKKFKVYICKKYEGEEDLMNKKIDEICSIAKLPSDDVIYFLVSLTVCVFSLAF